ncbi:hypothetical protein DYU11_08140 [Fibrisoma montanum]|uniref:ZU5 domain-containing protein n=1 Tax=Fibrisoma montanum TaxID=2305895 RepID=A0A418MEU7_9BACT|nr:hypothetical protein [Fibrisoma montanum]RIV25267.1 hypothetical protein DYU11_08140 [Fibrisoma montanum]
MNKLFTCMLSLVLAVSALSCKKESEIVKPDDSGVTTPPSQPNTPATGAVTPVGTPAGELVTATIGPAGGTIRSADERIRVDIPAGALTANQTISVQALDKNHCPGGTGTAFQLLPHGLTFAKPATITMHYEEQDLEGTAPELLRIAYQNGEKKWQSPVTASLDTTAKLMAVRTTHFSDWAILKSASLDPVMEAIDPGASVDLRVRYNSLALQEEGEFDPIPRPGTVNDKYVKDWMLEHGSGKLIENSTTVATYVAPERIPATNPAVVTVILSMKVNNVQKEIRLRAKIYVLGEGLVYRINGGPWIPTTSALGLSKVERGSGYYMTVQTGSVTPGIVSSVLLSWPVTSRQEGYEEHSLPWKLKTSENDLQIPVLTITTNPSGQPIYTFHYIENKTAYPSPGELRFIRKIDQRTGNDYYIGSFTMKKAGIYEYSGGTDQGFDGVANVEGFFRLRLMRTL